MNSSWRRVWGVACILGGMVGMTGCAVTFRTAQGTSETIENTSEASTKLTSSTSIRDDEPDREHLRDGKEEGTPDVEGARRFLEHNLKKVREDAAHGDGDYLESVGLMLGVTHDHMEDFFHMAHRNYGELFGDHHTTADQVTINLNEAVRRYPWLRDR